MKKMSNWISVKDKLPSEGSIRFVRNQKIQHKDKPLIFIAMFSKRTGWLFHGFSNMLHHAFVLGFPDVLGAVEVDEWLQIDGDN